jgi:CMP-N-acetylneuraminic acid synthetase|tara:strand:- start:150 stop:875 length:726 start_codon:yes stop_codon:yes gene_type:complete
MKNEQDIVAMIPARIGSTRLKMKNLALINGKPLIAYAIEAAKRSEVFNKIVVNSDDKAFAEIAKRYDVDFYLRPDELGSSTTRADKVVYDFMTKYSSTFLTWVNPTSPLQTGDEIRAVINYFIIESLDTLITVKNEQVHCAYNGGPVNFDVNEAFAQTQDLRPVQPFVYSIMMWKNKTFVEAFKKQGYAMFCGKVGYYPVSKETAIIIKTRKDIVLADYIMKAKESADGYKVQYDELAEKD